MATIEKFKVQNDGESYEVYVSETEIKVEKSGNLFGIINLKEADETTLNALKAGIGYGLALSKAKNFIQTSGKQENPTSYPNQSYVNQTYFPGAEGLPTNPGINPGMQNASSKVLSLNNGHSVLPDDRNNPPYQGQNGFISKVLVALLSSFGLGVITTAIYIFNHLSKVTINLS